MSLLIVHFQVINHALLHFHVCICARVAVTICSVVFEREKSDKNHITANTG